MTRTEFDQKIREMKTQKANAIRPIQVAQAEIKEEIASKYRQISEIKKEISKLQQATQGYHQQCIALEAEWRKKINDFIKENEPSTTSNLAEADTLNIVYELRRRGFSGIVQNDEIGELYDLDKHDWKHEE
jgi:predicted transcriptional regulator